MFDALTDRLNAVFRKLRSRGKLHPKQVDAALADIRTALLEADAALDIVDDFLGRVRKRALSDEVMRSLTPAQQVIKVVRDELMATLGGEHSPFKLPGANPVVIMMATGFAPGSLNGECSPPSVAISSSRTTLMTCWAGVRLRMTSSDSARFRTRPRKSSTMSRAASASSNAVRMSARAASTCFGWSLPRDRSLRKTAFRRSVSASNMRFGEAGSRMLAAPGHCTGGGGEGDPDRSRQRDRAGQAPGAWADPRPDLLRLPGLLPHPRDQRRPSAARVGYRAGPLLRLDRDARGGKPGDVRDLAPGWDAGGAAEARVGGLPLRRRHHLLLRLDLQLRPQGLHVGDRLHPPAGGSASVPAEGRAGERGPHARQRDRPGAVPR